MLTRYQRERESERFRAKQRGRKLLPTTFRPISTIDPKILQSGSHIRNWIPKAGYHYDLCICYVNHTRDMVEYSCTIRAQCGTVAEREAREQATALAAELGVDVSYTLNKYGRLVCEDAVLRSDALPAAT